MNSDQTITLEFKLQIKHLKEAIHKYKHFKHYKNETKNLKLKMMV